MNKDLLVWALGAFKRRFCWRRVANSRGRAGRLVVTGDLSERNANNALRLICKLFKSPNRHIKVSAPAAAVATAPTLVRVLVARIDARAGVDGTNDKRLSRVKARGRAGDGSTVAIGEISVAAFDFVAATARATKLA